MIPNVNVLTQELTTPTYYGKTFKIKFGSNESQLSHDSHGVLGVTMDVDLKNADRISGYIDGVEAVTQAVYLILSTERYKYIIYSWDYGVELVDLVGKPMPYVLSELPRRITEALTMDDRIDDVTDFEFTQDGKVLHTKFTVVSNVGNISTDLEMKVQ